MNTGGSDNPATLGASLPELFASRMRCLLKDEYGAFLTSYGEGRKNALRVNRLKISPAAFEAAPPFPVKRVPWTDNGYYVDYRDRPGQHPWYRAGMYYLQEPSAMAPARILPVSQGDRVLDLCAAPGGKATELGARLAGTGLLVANEISSTRVRALERNIELFGITNCIVTNEAPGRLSARFPEYFDKILVDAPCSGEGMFRKDPEAIRAWSPEKVEECARIQREIILDAADMLSPGGYMVYSTCTFEPEENELVIAHLLRERPDMELLKIPCTGGMECFSEAYTLPELVERGYVFPAGGKTGTEACSLAAANPGADACSLTAKTPGAEACSLAAATPGAEACSLMAEGSESEIPDLSKAVRIWPHRAGGEGHFIALLRKKEVRPSLDTEGRRKEKNEAAPKESDANPGLARKNGRANPGLAQKNGRANPGLAQKNGRADPGLPRKNGRAHQALARKNGGVNRELVRKSGRTNPEGNRGLDLALMMQFLSEYALDLHIDIKRIEIRDGHVYQMPVDCPPISGLRFLRAGLYLGELKKNRFEPSQELALALPPGGSGTEKHRIHFSISDGRLAAFLRGETVRLSENKENGWCLVCADDWPVGWGKIVQGVLKNHIPAAWRSASS